MPSPDRRDNRKNTKSVAAELLGLGLTFPAYVVAGYLLGHWVDGATGWSPIGTMIGVILGLVAALIPVFRLNARLTAKNDSRDP